MECVFVIEGEYYVVMDGFEFGLVVGEDGVV